MTKSKNPASKRNYRREYDTYHAKPEQKRKRAKRNAARAKYEATHGELPSTTDVNHKRRMAKGGTNSGANLEATSRSKNRSWRKGKKGYG